MHGGVVVGVCVEADAADWVDGSVADVEGEVVDIVHDYRAVAQPQLPHSGALTWSIVPIGRRRGASEEPPPEPPPLLPEPPGRVVDASVVDVRGAAEEVHLARVW